VRPFGKSRAAAEYAALHARADLVAVRAAALLQELAACEAALAGGNGRQPAAVTAGLLRGLAGRQRRRPGRGRVHRDAGNRQPARPHVIDETCSRVLWARFSPAGTRSQGTA